MDPQLLNFAQTAGTTMVALLVTESWGQTKDGVVALWRRFRPEAAEDVAQALETSRRSLLAAPPHESGSPVNEATRNLEIYWRRRIAELLSARPDAELELDGLLARLKESEQGQNITGGVALHAQASGSGRVYQAARDQHITER